MKNNPYMHDVNILIGMLLTILIAEHLVKRNCRIKNWLTDSSFFIYAYHILPLLLVAKMLWKIFQPDNSFGALMIYFTTPVIVITLGIALYNMLQRVLPNFTKILVGGR